MNSSSPLSRPLLSIVTVCLNDAEGLRKTLSSLREQIFENYEHILIDGGSTDESPAVIADYATTSTHVSYWVSEPDGGIYFGMNKGLEKMQGEYVYFLNAGDVLLPNVLEKIPFDGTQFIYGQHPFSKESVATYTPPKIDMITLIKDNPHHQASFMHRSLFDGVCFRTDFRIISDWIHCYEAFVFQRCTHSYVPLKIALCDRSGVSANFEAVMEERRRYFQSLPPVLSQALIDCNDLHTSGLRPLLAPFCAARRWKKLLLTLLRLLLRLAKLYYRVMERNGRKKFRFYQSIWLGNDDL